MLIYNDILRELFRFFERKQLSSLQFVCRHFKSIIDAEFSDAPHVILPYVLRYRFITHDEWTWKMADPNEIQLAGSLPQELVDVLPKLKFLRFQKTQLIFMTYEMAAKIVPSISHVWKGQLIWFKLHDTVTSKLTNLLTTARKVLMKLHAIQRNETNTPLFDVNSERLFLCGDKIDTFVSVKIILDFLFPARNAKQILLENEASYLSINFIADPTPEFRFEIFDAIGQVFLSASRPMDIVFAWNNGDLTFPYNMIELTRMLENPNTGEKLGLFECSCNNNAFLIKMIPVKV
ncbi:hypothetical protein Ddc_12608 [Ditylenchus destructor]|nr:hypothetical protein Ddc_12608 [Ditylenchus destructor]